MRLLEKLPYLLIFTFPTISSAMKEKYWAICAMLKPNSLQHNRLRIFLRLFQWRYCQWSFPKKRGLMQSHLIRIWAIIYKETAVITISPLRVSNTNTTKLSKQRNWWYSETNNKAENTSKKEITTKQWRNIKPS